MWVAQRLVAIANRLLAIAYLPLATTANTQRSLRTKRAGASWTDDRVRRTFGCEGQGCAKCGADEALYERHTCWRCSAHVV